VTKYADKDTFIDQLDEQWRTSAGLADGFSEVDWDSTTDLPGWTVKDNFSHLVGTEAWLRGEPLPEVDTDGFDHLTAPSSPTTEPAVAVRRERSGPEVLAEFREVTAARIADLRTMTDEEWETETMGPVGPQPYWDFMDIRLYDCWMHEQDCRRALGLAGNQDSAAADHAMWRHELAAGFVVGKKAKAPDGSSVVFDLSGPLARTVAVVVDGRAQVVDEAPADPTVRIGMDTETYWCLGGGRWDPAAVLASGNITIEGDRELGERVVQSMNFMI
jgi:uncharacterized protein (TIGR03083 family)